VRFALALLAAVCAAAPAKTTAGLATGPVFPVGSWGDSFGSGLEFQAFARWMFSERFGAGPGLSMVLYGDEYDGDASLDVLTPEISAAFHLRPGARSFSPGIEVGLGYSRSSLESGGGSDPVTWDPSWRAGIRWEFGMGAGFRGAAGFDFKGIVAREETADGFALVFRVSREVLQ
jgi:hypothetical protein